jgi:hypothetical protein
VVEPSGIWKSGGWAFFKGIVEHQASLRELKAAGFPGSALPENRPFCDAGSLRLLASVLSKSERTIRRYCEAGLIPHAKRTRSGHWRINYWRFNRRQYIVMLNRLSRRMRQKTEIRNSTLRMKNNVLKISDRAWNGYQLYLASVDKLPEDVDTKEKRERLDFADNPIPGEVWRAIEIDRKLALLLVGAKRLSIRGIPATAKNLAGELGLSRAGLYRHFRPSQVAKAFRDGYNYGSVQADTGEHNGKLKNTRNRAPGG